MKGLKTVLWTGLIGLVGATTYYLSKQVKLLTSTLYEFGGVQIDKLNFSEVKITILYKILNKSDIGISILEKDLTVLLNGQEVARIQNDKKILLKAHRCVTLPIPINLKTCF